MDPIISGASKADINILNDDKSSLGEQEKMEQFLRSLDPLRRAMEALDAEAYLNQSKKNTDSIDSDKGNGASVTAAATR